MWRGTVLTDCAVQVHIGEEVTQPISVAYSLSVTYSLKSYCKMPPKQATSKKSKEKKKTQAIADATFGLKNKNKSAKVQKLCQTSGKFYEEQLVRCGAILLS